MSDRETIVELLIRRDFLSRLDAEAAYDDVYSEIMDAVDGTSGLDPEDVLFEELGLEPDYLIYFF